jgi:protein-disulfide isomerase
MRRLTLLALISLTACAHSAADEAHTKAGADQQDELARAIERIGLQQDALAQDVRELKRHQEQLASTVSQLDATVKELKAAKVDRPRPSGPDADAIYNVPIGDAAVRGPGTAKITLVEYSDFQCPFCGRVNATIRQIVEAYPDEVRVVFKHNPLPFHPNALPAAKAVEAAHQQGKFWAMHDLLFEGQQNLSAEAIDVMAGKLQLNLKKFKAALGDDKIADKIKAHADEGNRLGARGTPSFFINGRFLAGAQPLESFKAVIDEELKRADRLLATGVKRAELYDQLIADGKTRD